MKPLQPNQSRPATAEAGPVDRTDEENQKAAEFIHELDAAMEKKFGPVARIDDSPAIWLAYTERSVIQLSRKKSGQLLELEGALALSHKAGWSEESIAGVREAAAAVQSTNHEINDERAKGARAVEAFVTFEDSDDKEKAVDSGGCEYNGQACWRAIVAWGGGRFPPGCWARPAVGTGVWINSNTTRRAPY